MIEHTTVLYQQLARRPVLCVGMLMIVVLMCVPGIMNLGFDDGLRSVFKSKQENFIRFDHHTGEFSQTENDVIILVSSKSEFTSGQLGSIREMVLDAHLLDKVEAVFSIFSLQKINQQSGNIEPLFPQEFDVGTKISGLLKDARNMNFAGISLLSSQNDKTVLVVTLDTNASNLSIASPVLRDLKVLAQDLSALADLEVELTGMLPIRNHIINGLKRDQALINVIGAILGFFASLIIFRSVIIAVLNGIAPVFALYLALSVFGYTGINIDVVTNALPVLLLVLASSDCTHITYEIRRRSGAGEPIHSAILASMRDMTAPCILTSLTTILAFSSLYFSQSPIIKGLAIAGSLGVFIALLTILFVHPLVFVLASRVPAFARLISDPAKPLMARVSTGGLFRAVIRRKRLVTVAGLALAISAFTQLFPIQTQYRFYENIDLDQPIMETLRGVEKIAGPLSAIEIPLYFKDASEVFSDQMLADIKNIHELFEAGETGGTVVSLHTIIRFLNSQNRNVSKKTISDAMDLLPEQYRYRMISRDGAAILLSIMVADDHSAAVRSKVRKIQSVLDKLSLKTLEPGKPTGFLEMASGSSHYMIGQLTISFFIAALACSFLIGVWYRKVSYGLAAVLPNVLPIACVGAVLTMIGADIQFSSALALTIAFGIAVDDTVHVFNRLSLEQKNTLQLSASNQIIAAMSHISPALLTTTAILTGGMIATGFSAMPMIRYFGLLCAITFVLALLCDLVLLPAILALSGRFSKG
ncbi:MAG: MMPL family transporter [Cohaesibacteraceae bacterium]|nr:MMPL family transporter [Cohaesibacteraceae bacterium]